MSNQVVRNSYSEYYLRDTVQSQISQLQQTSAVAPNVQSTNAIVTFKTSATGPTSDHNALNNTNIFIDQDNNLQFGTSYATIGMIGPTGTYATGPTGCTPIISLGTEPAPDTGDFGNILSVGMYNGNAIPTNPDTTLFNNTLMIGFNNYTTGLTGLTGGGYPDADEYDNNIIIGCNNVANFNTTDFYENTIVGNNILSNADPLDGSITDNVLIGTGVAVGMNGDVDLNVVIGPNSLTSNTASPTSFNVVIGASSLQSAGGTCVGNVVIGGSAGNHLTGNCQSNVGIGIYALGQSNPGPTNAINSNVAIGDRAGYSLSDGAQWNTLVGTESGYSLGGVTGNAVFGGGLGAATGLSNNNTIIGYRSMACTGTVSGCSVLGRANVQGTTGGTYSNNLYLDPNVELGPESNVIRIGNSSHSKFFSKAVRGVTTTNADAISVLVDSSGQLGTVSSSAKYKRNIEDIDYDSVTKIISQMRPTKFNQINCDGEIQQKKSLGLIAEEVEKIYPDMCIYQDGELLTVDYNRLTIMLLADNQQLRKELNDIKTMLKMDELRSRVSKSLMP